MTHQLHPRRSRGVRVKQHRIAGPTVTVVGAGIAGLTAAHELIERGFVVQVVESAVRPESPNEVAVGGMARSHYGRVPEVVQPPTNLTPHAQMQRVSPPVCVSERVFFAVNATEPTESELQTAVARVVAQLKEVAEAVEAHRIPRMIDGLEVRGHADADETQRFSVSLTRAERVAVVLGSALAKSGHKALQQLDVRVSGVGDTEQLAPSTTAEGRARNARVDIHVLDHLVPGEHGYRFFPSFYRHVFDTMKRTPLLDAHGQETGLTAFDNLVATSTQALALDDNERAPADFLRKKFTSVEQLRQQLEELHTRLHVEYADVAQYYVKMCRYMATSPERRTAEYEDLSWWDFLQRGQNGRKLKYSAAFSAAAKAAPQALVAMKAEVADARTQGSITVQLTLDQATDGAHTDCTLNGPTTEAWLLPWRRYLIRQGVQFFHGELLDLAPREHGVRAKFVTTPVPAEGDAGVHPIAYDNDPAYYVLALHPQQLQAVTQPLVEGASPDSDVARLAKLELDAPVDPAKANYSQLLQHFVGVQFYFANDIKFVQGHVYFPQSEWGLSAVSQLQFWKHRRNQDDGFLGQLSVDVGNCLAKSATTGKCALECTPQELAEECWLQISRAMQGPGRAHDVGMSHFVAMPQPLYYHVDDHLLYTRTKGKWRLTANQTPFLINTVGTWAKRPGDPDGYHVANNQVVLAGNAMRTYTRMSTMEASNESARHAVNAIIRHLRDHGPAVNAAGHPRTFALVAGDLCDFWNPEDLELADFMPLRRLDKKLLDQGLPHLFDLLNVDELVQGFAHLPRGSQLIALDRAIRDAILRVFPELTAADAQVDAVRAHVREDLEAWVKGSTTSWVTEAERARQSAEDLGAWVQRLVDRLREPTK